jgi:hypothetical protein
VRLRTAGIALFGLALLPLKSHGALAQSDTRNESIRDLPRPGYEPKQIRLGSTVVSPEVIAGGEYDSNVYATSRNADDDLLLTLAPTVAVRHDDGRMRLDANLFAVLRHYDEHPREDVNTFGLTSTGRWQTANDQSLTGRIDAERSFQRRGDPEARTDTLRGPARINVGRVELGYQYQPGRFGLTVNGAAEKLNFLPRDEDDRDLLTLRGSTRVSVRATPRISAFVEGYINKRDARTAVDRTGVDRDALTKGALAGIAVSVADRLQGEFGLGVFRSNPDDARLRSFTGFAASGSMVWRPRVRTSLTAEVFRGDVATIRAGANGRIDARGSLRLDQEVRHNLLFSATVGVRNTRYRGSIDRNQTTYTGEVESTYLVTRHVQLVASVRFARRDADQRLEEFERVRGGLAVRLVY